ncbi:YncE family protein [Actinoplanes regularis]|uniref:40-residue YVTN family beta-propeller repeat-containing protein n=1 Tax=Actinoplanes regularis TaxID=52697 RepID=A0A239AXT2_9ACTN|nr:YncE family protein [Actinoplanes regularis]GIE87325.1 hypothetical protein Are01nite_38050 [Actinoplanes regularis]SNR99788.1 hypothetical protein SAMN06264365_108160 [Actinoplanes regularis]
MAGTPAQAAPIVTKEAMAQTVGTLIPGKIRISRDGTHVWAINATPASTSILKMVKINSIPAWVSVPLPDDCVEPGDIAFSTDSDTMYVTAPASNKILVLDAGTGAPTGRGEIGTFGSPNGIAVANVGGSDVIYVVNSAVGAITAYRADGIPVGRWTPATFEPIAVTASPDGSRVFVAGSNGVIMPVRTADQIALPYVIAEVGSGSVVRDLAITPNGSTLMVALDSDLDPLNGDDHIEAWAIRDAGISYLNGATTRSLLAGNVAAGWPLMNLPFQIPGLIDLNPAGALCLVDAMLDDLDNFIGPFPGVTGIPPFGLPAVRS